MIGAEGNNVLCFPRISMFSQAEMRETKLVTFATFAGSSVLLPSIGFSCNVVHSKTFGERQHWLFGCLFVSFLETFLLLDVM